MLVRQKFKFSQTLFSNLAVNNNSNKNISTSRTTYLLWSFLKCRSHKFVNMLTVYAIKCFQLYDSLCISYLISDARKQSRQIHRLQICPRFYLQLNCFSNCSHKFSMRILARVFVSLLLFIRHRKLLLCIESYKYGELPVKYVFYYLNV